MRDWYPDLFKMESKPINRYLKLYFKLDKYLLEELSHNLTKKKKKMIKISILYQNIFQNRFLHIFNDRRKTNFWQLLILYI